MEQKRVSAKVRERRLRRKYQKRIFLAVVISLIVGLVVGFIFGMQIGKKSSTTEIVEVPVAVTPEALTLATEAPVFTEPAEPTEAPVVETKDEATEAPVVVVSEPVVTAEPTATPVPTPTPAPEAERVVSVPFGRRQVIKTDVNLNGTTEQLNFQVTVGRYMTPEYYDINYSNKYQLTGTEAGVEFELVLNDYMGKDAVLPQNVLDISVETADGTVETGYQLVDAEIHGKNEVVIDTNIPTMFYKRFSYSRSVGDMSYLNITATADGVTTKYQFELDEPLRPVATPTPEVTLRPIVKGEKGDDVKILQQQLIDLGYLTGTADGDFGGKTEKAIKAAQEDFGQEPTGIADHAFRTALNAAAEEKGLADAAADSEAESAN